MIHVLLPRDDVNRFIDDLNYKVVEEHLGSGCYYSDVRSRGEFSVVDYTYDYVTFELVDKVIKNRWPEYITRYVEEKKMVCVSKHRITYQNGTPNFTIVTANDYDQWVYNVKAAIDAAECPFPFAVEFNGSDAYLNRYYPTIMILPYQQWYNQGRPHIQTAIKPLHRGKTAKLVLCPHSFEGKNLRAPRDYPDKYVVLPTCVIKENENGWGNTVTFTQTTYTTETEPEFPSIFDLMTDKVFWEKMNLRLMFTPIAELKEEVKNYQTPASLQLKMYALSRQTKIRQEIAALEDHKKAYQRDIDSWIASITTHKAEMKRFDDDIISKRKELARRSSVKALESELKNLKNLSFVKDFNFSMGGFTVYLTELPILGGPVLGPYKVYYSTAAHNITVWNEGNPVVTKWSTYNSPAGRELAHPHITQGGNPCMGNYSDMFYRFEVGEYVVAVTMVKEYLSSYNPDGDSWGYRLAYWDAKWFFEDVKERGLLDRVEEVYDEFYREIYGRSMHPKYCSHCNKEIGGIEGDRCECERCTYCHQYVDDCECNFCPRCGEHVDNCDCERCPKCAELLDECLCHRCEQCGALTDNYYDPHCECERCPYDYDVLVQEDGACMECETWDCGNNTHPDRERHLNQPEEEEEENPLF